MPNLLLTERCVRSCPYCFAREHMDTTGGNDTLAWDDLIYVADLLEQGNEKHLSLLGGEPTLHPDFVDFVSYLVARDFHVTVFTSGIMSDARLKQAQKRLLPAAEQKVGFVVNVNHPDICPDNEQERLDAFLSAFGPLCSPGFNIYQPKFEMRFTVDYINRYGMKRHIRIGLTHPIPGEKNAYVKREEMPSMIACFMEHTPLFERFSISPGFDCGFPLCLFTDEQMGKLFRIMGGQIKFGCGPAVDIGPDMSVWACFPLSQHYKKSLFEFNSFHEVRYYYLDIHNSIRAEAGGIFAACDECRYRKSGLCSGGCLAHIVAQLADEAPVRRSEVYS